MMGNLFGKRMTETVSEVNSLDTGSFMADIADNLLSAVFPGRNAQNWDSLSLAALLFAS